MKQDEYNPRDIDYVLREIINNIHPRIDQLYYGLYDELSLEEKQEFAVDLKNQADKLYESINNAIVEKANQVNNLNKKIFEMNSELTTKNKKLHENQKLKDFLYNTIIHDMKNPLVAILSYSDTLLGQRELGGKLANFINYIKQSSVFLHTMILNILDISKIEEKKFIARSDLVPLETLIDKTLELFQLHIEISKAQIVKEITYTDQINIDESLIERVFINILSNAFKYVSLNGKIIIKVFEQNECIFIEIINTGSVIPLENQEHIFDKYYSEKAENNYQAGTGLGLTFCKMAVETCGGNICIKSPYFDDDGTAFIISFDKKAVLINY